MGSTITAKYPFSGKNQVCLIAEEVTTTTAINDYGKNRVETIVGSTPAGEATWKSLGYVTGGQTTETRTMEDIGSIGYRNVQQMAETKFEVSGSLNLEYQNARIIYLGMAANNGLVNCTTVGTMNVLNGAGISHSTNVTTAPYKHVIYEPEVVSGSFTSGAIPETPSFNLIDGYNPAASAQPRVVRKYVGCKVDSMAFEFGKDGTIKINTAWKGAQVYASQATTLANLTLSDYINYEEVFPPVFGKIYLQAWAFPTGTTPATWTTTLDAGLATAANQLGDVQNASMSISNNLEALFVIGDTTARNMIAQQRKYDGRMTIAFENEEQHVKFLGTFTGTNTWATNPSGKGDGVGSVTGSVLTDATQTWVTSELVGGNLVIAGVSYPITANDADRITVTGTPSAGAANYAITNVVPGYGTWIMPWKAQDRMQYYALKYFYDNSSLGYTTSSTQYRRFEATFLGVKFKSMGSPRVVNGIVYHDFEWTALMLAPFNAADVVGGFTIYDGIPGTAATGGFHSIYTGIV
jgi:hypothetical protein